jgi:hypothetical protein
MQVILVDVVEAVAVTLMGLMTLCNVDDDFPNKSYDIDDEFPNKSRCHNSVVS